MTFTPRVSFLKAELAAWTFFQSEVASATGIPSETISNLIKREKFKPSAPNPGKGHRRGFNWKDVVRLTVLYAAGEHIGYDEALFAVNALHSDLEHDEPPQSSLNRRQFLVVEKLVGMHPTFSSSESERYLFWRVDGATRDELEVQRPSLIIPWGKMAIDAFNVLLKPYLYGDAARQHYAAMEQDEKQEKAE